MKQSLADIEVILLDIEGTICPITFVKETLFPYALSSLPKVLETQWSSPEFQPYKSAFPATAQESPEALLNHVKDLTARDVKIAYLKNLQGYLWQDGYKNKIYSTPLYPDVVPNLRNYHAAGKKLAIYSSGSIFAQKLLFAHVQDPSPLPSTNYYNHNDDSITPNHPHPPPPPSQTKISTIDLTNLIESTHPSTNQTSWTSWFDTTNAGPKTHPQSYTTITNNLNLNPKSNTNTTNPIPPSKILFLSDNIQEIAAALEAGIRGVVIDRPGNAPIPQSERHKYDIVTTFDELDIS